MKYLNRLFFLSVLAIAAVQGRAQTPVHVKPEISYTQDHARYILGGLVVEGDKNYDEDVLTSISGLTVGQMYDVPGEDISEAIRRYMKQKSFSNVRIEADSIVGSKIYLHIYLQGLPQVSSINYGGVKKSEREEIEKRLGLQVGSYINPDIIDRAKIHIKRYFEEKGFKNAQVSIDQRNDVTAENRVLLDINIDKNEKIKVHRIYIAGVTEKEAKKLKRAMKKTHEKSLVNIFRSKKFVPEKYTEDKDHVISKMNSSSRATVWRPLTMPTSTSISMFIKDRNTT